MILLCQTYTPASEARRAELKRCYEENDRCGVFQEIVYVAGDEKRLTYNDFFALAASEYQGEKCVVANTDISFRHPSCLGLSDTIAPGRLVALTRWHDDLGPWFVGQYVNNRFFAGSQDVWGFVGGEFVGIADIPLGEPGCDCRLTAKVVRTGAAVWNPCLSIRTMHVHADLNDTGLPSPPGEYGYAEMTTSSAVGAVFLRQFYPTILVGGAIRERTT